MTTKPNFLVFSSPYEQEENDYKSCFILVEIPDKEVCKFVDYLDANTALSVDAYMHHNLFISNFGEYQHCTVIEVHVKEKTGNPALSCERISMEETDRYLKR